MSENTETTIEAKSISAENISKTPILAENLKADSHGDIKIPADAIAMAAEESSIRSLVRELIALAQSKHEPEGIRSIEFTRDVVRILGNDNSLRVVKLDNLPDADWHSPEASA